MFENNPIELTGKEVSNSKHRSGRPEAFDRAIINESPLVDLMIRGGVHGDLARAPVVINMIPKVAAKPCLVTIADLSIPSTVGVQ
jgi:hypothetical protein